VVGGGIITSPPPVPILNVSGSAGSDTRSAYALPLRYSAIGSLVGLGLWLSSVAGGVVQLKGISRVIGGACADMLLVAVVGFFIGMVKQTYHRNSPDRKK
jgi:hypothetical protein